MNLWQTLLHPDREELEDAERREVGRAANILQVGEFQLLQLAYLAWHGKDLPETLVDRLFHDYMIHNDVPHWARHYARQILRLEKFGRLDANRAQYHLYDRNYGKPVRNGVLRFWLVTGCLLVAFGGAIVVAKNSIVSSSSMFPPHLTDQELRQMAQQAAASAEGSVGSDGFGRADNIQPKAVP